jgi:cation diffusion facilitator CzcD-associated flavoprotein CzcO
MSSTPPVAVIVGAGPAGLATAAELRRRGLPYRLLERGPSLGHAWRNTYDSLRLHTGRHMSALPGLPFPPGTPLFPTRDDFVTYLDAYAAAFELTVEPGREVRRARRNGDWTVETGTDLVTASNVVVATGIMANPRRPRLAGEGEYGGRLLHSVTYRRPEDFRGMRVLVVGVGNSGGEIASELGHAGVDTTIAIRSGANVVPREIAGVPTQYVVYGLRVLPRTARSWIAERVRTLSEMRRGAPPFPRAAGSPIDSVPLIGFHLVDAIRAGHVRVRLAGLDHLTARGVRFSDGSEEAFDAVILATGFAPALDFLGDQVRRDAKGFALRNDRVTSADQPGLYFVGHNYDTTGGLANINRDARIVAGLIARGGRR